MKRLVFYVDFFEKLDLCKLIRQIGGIPCNVKLDFEENTIIVENIQDELVDAIVDMIYDICKIKSLDIENN